MNNDYPILAIGIITYNRHYEFNEVLASILHRVKYPADKLRFVVSDDGSSRDYVSQLETRESFTVLRHNRLGMGGNWNKMIAACHEQADFVLCCQDDWKFTEPIDLRLAVRLLQVRPEYGMVRYHKLSGHTGLPAVVKEWDTSECFEGFADGLYEYVPHMMTFFELLPPFDGNNTFSPYSGGVHLRHKRFTDCYGQYQEGVGFSDSEQRYFENVNHYLRLDLNTVPRVALFPRYVHSRFEDIGESYRNTDVEKETIRND